VSLGSSTVQFHESLGSRRACVCSTGFSSQNGDVFEECTTEEQSSIVLFYDQKDSMQRIFTKKCFFYTVRRVFRVKRLINW
jgi:hypothetical protein